MERAKGFEPSTPTLDKRKIAESLLSIEFDRNAQQCAQFHDPRPAMLFASS
jgi:hypothetical protein